MNHWILDERGDPVLADLLTWAQWIETHHAERVVAKDQIGDATISTVFLGLNHRFDDRPPPLLWETLVFGGPCDGDMRRYAYRDEAIAGHQAMCLTVHAACATNVNLKD